MLHLANGDLLARRIQAAGLLRPLDPALRNVRDPDLVVAWRDILYQGPVRAGRSPINLSNDRAQYIASQGWEPFILARQAFGERDAALARAKRHEEVVFWFEDDLYDGLQLAQALDRVAIRRPEGTAFGWVLLASRPAGGGEPDASGADLQDRFARRQTIPVEAFADARAFWTAFIAAEPIALAELVHGGGLTTPVLAATGRRVLSEYPAVGSGLSLSERQVLAALTGGPATPPEILRAAADADPRPFLGDLQVWERLDRFATAAPPLIRRVDGGVWASPIADLMSVAEPDMDAFAAQVLELTETGRAVRAGEQDLLALGVASRWVGGVEFDGPSSWRWDDDRAALVEPATVS